MLAIFKKELIHLFKSPIAYIYLAVNALISAIFFVSYNLFSSSANFSDFLNRSQVIFFLSIPLLTMNLYADEKKYGTEKLLLTSPISTFDIVIGKFLASLVPFGITLALYLLYYTILEILGYPDFGKSFASLLGFIMLALSFISLGLFISVLSQNQIISAILCFAIMFLFWLLPSLDQIIPRSILSGEIFLVLLSSLLCLFFYSKTYNKLLTIMLSFIFASLITLIALFNIDFYNNLIINSLNFFSLSTRFEFFTKGIIRLSDILFYISFTYFFLHLSSYHLSAKKWSK